MLREWHLSIALEAAAEPETELVIAVKVASREDRHAVPAPVRRGRRRWRFLLRYYSRPPGDCGAAIPARPLLFISRGISFFVLLLLLLLIVVVLFLLLDVDLDFLVPTLLVSVEGSSGGGGLSLTGAAAIQV